MRIDLAVYEPPLNVTREPGSSRFLVRSQNPRKKWEHYIVDLDEPGYPHGWCECANYDYRIEPKVRRAMRAPHDGECKHIKRVRSQIELCRIICESLGEDPSQAPLRIPDIREYERRKLQG